MGGWGGERSGARTQQWQTTEPHPRGGGQGWWGKAGVSQEQVTSSLNTASDEGLGPQGRM